MRAFRKHRRTARLALLAASSLVGLVLAEGLARWLLPDGLEPDGRSLEQKLTDSERSAPREGETISLRGLVRASSNPRLAYELKPGLTGLFHHAAVRVNEAGWRGALRQRRKPEGTRRVLGIGDSVAFGWGVGEDETFLAGLERLLNERGSAVEVLNFGVPGYNTMQEAEQLESVGLYYAPDAVVVAWVDNDVALPNFLLQPDGSLLQRLTLARRLARGDEPEDLVADGARRVPAEYVSMVGMDAVQHGLARIGYLSRRHGFRAYLFCFNGRHAIVERVRRWCGELGVTFLDLAAWRTAHGLTDEAALRLSARDMHPSVGYHAAIARFLAEALERDRF